MTEQERDAMTLLDRAIDHGAVTLPQACARTIKEMVAQPRMPEEPTDEIRSAMWNAWNVSDPTIRGHNMTVVYRALRKHLSEQQKPRISVLRALCIAKTLKGEGELGDALRLLAELYVERCGEPK